MWSARHLLHAAVPAVALLLAACGFQPLYGQGDGASASRGLQETRVERIPDRDGQRLRTQLEILFHSGELPSRYALHVELATNIRDVAIRKDETATRRNIVARADYTLVRIEDGARVNQGTARSTNSYNISESDFATRIAQEDAVARALEQLAVSIQTQLAIFFRESEPR